MSTKVGKSGQTSLMTCIPVWVVEYLEINKGSKLNWKIDKNSKEPALIITKSK